MTDGPLMFCATKVLSPGPTRISRVTNHITLPRTVAVPVLIASTIGAFLGFITMLIVTRSLTSLMMASVLGGAAGWVAASWSPLKGESFAKWLGLKVRATGGRMTVDGELVRVHIGVAPAHRIAAGRTRVLPGAVTVRDGTVDADGRLVDSIEPHTVTPTAAIHVRAPRRAAPADLGTKTPRWARNRGTRRPETDQYVP